LNQGLKIDGIFDMIRGLIAKEPFASGQVPLVGMVSYSLVYHRGPEKFIRQAQEAGLAGASVPDLPVEESTALATLAKAADFKLIQLVTPTTPPERAKQIAATSTGFLYCVSVIGITGERSQLPPQLMEQLAWLRTQTDLPLCVGFGISTPEHVKTLKPAADGVIVGSHFVRRLEQASVKPLAEVVKEIGDQVALLAGALQ
jgi:tryptophan synthase alpha chain